MTALPHTTLTEALEGTGAGGDVLARRRNIVEMTAAAEAAVLRPAEPGAWPHGLRAALAARIAHLHGEAALADRFRAGADAQFRPVADPAHDGAAEGLAPVVAFVDRVATSPREATAEDIAALKAAGVADADIVRLAEIVAFLAYALRVVRGLRLLGGRP